MTDMESVGSEDNKTKKCRKKEFKEILEGEEWA